MINNDLAPEGPSARHLEVQLRATGFDGLPMRNVHMLAAPCRTGSMERGPGWALDAFNVLRVRTPDGRTTYYPVGSVLTWTAVGDDALSEDAQVRLAEMDRDVEDT